MNRRPLILPLSLLLPVILACSGFTDCGRKAQEVVPALEKVNPEFATESVDCGDPYPTPAPRGCAMQTISCGQEVQGNNQFGQKNYDDEFYVKKFCGVQRNHYDEAPEAIYLLELPSNIEAKIILASDCEDLDIASISVPPDATDRCPTISHSVQVCEMDQKRGGGKVQINTVDRPETHFIVIDGKKGATGNFRLRVDCRTGR